MYRKSRCVIRQMAQTGIVGVWGYPEDMTNVARDRSLAGHLIELS